MDTRLFTDSEKIFLHLKAALRKVSLDLPFRGPEIFTIWPEEEFVYISKAEGDVNFFFGNEMIKRRDVRRHKPFFDYTVYRGVFHGLITGA